MYSTNVVVHEHIIVLNLAYIHANVEPSVFIVPACFFAVGSYTGSLSCPIFDDTSPPSNSQYVTLLSCVKKFLHNLIVRCWLFDHWDMSTVLHQNQLAV